MSDTAEPATRATGFIKSAIAILGETGRTDFTVQEVVARSRTSLRSFYQHFSGKDDLLLALVEKTMAQSVQTWRAETAALDAGPALKLVIERVSAQPESSTQDSLNRALSLYNQHLAETRPRDYARVLSPLHQLLCDLIGRGVAAGVFRPDPDLGAAAAIVMQTVLGALRLHWLGAELTGSPIDTGQLYDFCVRALGADPKREAPTPSLAQLFAQIGLREATSGDGQGVMTMPVNPRVVNTGGALQGGLIATLADVAGGKLALEHIPAGAGLTTADLAVRYLRPITGGAARAIPRLLRAGRQSVVVQVDVLRSSDDELAATASVSFAVVHPRGGQK